MFIFYPAKQPIPSGIGQPVHHPCAALPRAPSRRRLATVRRRRPRAGEGERTAAMPRPSGACVTRRRVDFAVSFGVLEHHHRRAKPSPSRTRLPPLDLVDDPPEWSIRSGIQFRLCLVCEFWKFSYRSIFVFICQLVFNHGLVRLKTFVS